jgi:hypothetical protein
MQIGGGIVLSSGVFTAPVAGIYVFTSTWLDSSDSEYATVYIRKNELAIGEADSYLADHNSFGITVLVSLARGNTVDTYLLHGQIQSGDDRWIHFTGHLIYPTAA